MTAGLVFRRGGGSQVSYAFKHALVQDAAYGSLLLSRRQQLHARIAHILEERFPETVATEPELLAHHFGQASLVEKAVEYHELAGRRALSRSSLSEALVRFGNALNGLNRSSRIEGAYAARAFDSGGVGQHSSSSPRICRARNGCGIPAGTGTV